MGPISAIGSVLSKYFQIRGRASRSEFWWWSLAQFFGLLACISVDLALYDPATTQIGFFSFVTPVYVLGTLIPNFTVTIRRLHDIGRSGLWYLISICPLAIWSCSSSSVCPRNGTTIFMDLRTVGPVSPQVALTFRTPMASREPAKNRTPMPLMPIWPKATPNRARKCAQHSGNRFSPIIGSAFWAKHPRQARGDQ